MGFSELVVVAVVALLLFGGRLPEVMRSMGAAYRNLRRSWDDLSRHAFDPVRSVARDVYRPSPTPSVGPPATGPDAGAAQPPGASSAVTVAAPLTTPAATPAAPPAAAPAESTGMTSGAARVPVAAAPAARSLLDDDLPLV